MSTHYEHATIEHCQKLRGLHMSSPEAEAICNEVNWNGTWPVVDTEGVYTGQIAESADARGIDWVLVDWDASGKQLIEGCTAAIDPDDLDWTEAD